MDADDAFDTKLETPNNWGYSPSLPASTDGRNSAAASGETEFAFSPLTPIAIIVLATLYIMKKRNWPCCAAPISPDQRAGTIRASEEAPEKETKVMPLKDIESIVGKVLEQNSTTLEESHFRVVSPAVDEKEEDPRADALIPPEPSLARRVSCETKRLGYTIAVPLFSFQRRTNKSLEHSTTPTTLDSSCSGGSEESDMEVKVTPQEIDLEMGSIPDANVASIPGLQDEEHDEEECIIFDHPPPEPTIVQTTKKESDCLVLERTCAICLDDFVAGDTISIAASPSSEEAMPLFERACEHVFHQDCIQEWLVGLERKTQRKRAQGNGKYGAENEGKMNLTCPCCRQLFLDIPLPENS